MTKKLFSRTGIGTAIAVAIIVFAFFIGAQYLLAPVSTASTFGVPSWPQGQGEGFLYVKGVRDVVSGLVMLAVLVAGSRRTLGWAMLAEAVTPLGDMLIVLGTGGSPATAFGVHGATAAVVALGGALLLAGSPSVARSRNARAAAATA
ncbi:DUF4267 domain-containing protein [Goodfellowiella coeruleoviolacea]|uniref:Small membrane hydrophobic protein n=1 Tax=Goodfellowiella coeruleoviolacea TaxID=334858 RepID=A0AAE3KH25_9PSEU|nr:DUF4267 domain-containing protein [Goodfellowiella coeruleoviolacea]MCP2166865.1 protein of unknown function (DUF4267) [Goodfellowiella coeruleoviolacea]